MKEPRILARSAAILSSILLVTGFISYRTGSNCLLSKRAAGQTSDVGITNSTTPEPVNSKSVASTSSMPHKQRDEPRHDASKNVVMPGSKSLALVDTRELWITNSSLNKLMSPVVSTQRTEKAARELLGKTISRGPLSGPSEDSTDETQFNGLYDGKPGGVNRIENPVFGTADGMLDYGDFQSLINHILKNDLAINIHAFNFNGIGIHTLSQLLLTAPLDPVFRERNSTFFEPNSKHSHVLDGDRSAIITKASDLSSELDIPPFFLSTINREAGQ